ncbi:MAG: RNase P subunit p30 family protein [Candidatus Hodarchaeota archaeon]
MPYFESRLKVNINDFDDIEKKLEFCMKLGIRNLILEPLNTFIPISSNLREKIIHQKKLNIYFRYNLTPNSINEFKNAIKNYNNFPYILSVESKEKEIQINAARDSRVDIVSFSDENILKTLSSGVISLTKQNNSFIEFSLATIMVRNKALQSKNFRYLYKFIQLAYKLKANIIISGNFDDLFDLRHPRSLISICHSLLDIPLNSAKRIFMDNPKLLLEKAQNRKNNNSIESGVRIIKGGDLN